MTVSDGAENAGVIARPPVLYTTAFVLGMLVELLLPTSFLPGMTGPALGIAFVLGGFGLMAVAMRYFRLAGTPIETSMNGAVAASCARPALRASRRSRRG